MDGLDVQVTPAAPGAEELPALVFLHEGLGSIGLWRSFPEDVRAATGSRSTVVYSRHGYGWSAALAQPRAVTYMHDEADHVLPTLLRGLAIERPVLIGHSDGASIALLHAGAGHPVTGLVLLAPHVFVEACTIEAITAAREAYATTDLPTKLARHHRDPDATFRGWNDIWLAPEFRSWNIEERLPGIAVPVLVIQGADDPYGTLAQLDAIERGVHGPVERLVLPDVGHAAHLEAPDVTVAAIAAFVAEHGF